MHIIGVTGTNGAGKGTIVNFLIKEYGFIYFSVRDFLIKDLQKQGLKINRENMINTANDLRGKYGADYIVTKLYQEALDLNKPAIIESIRCIGEVNSLKEFPDFKLLGVDAQQTKRYERSILRKTETDQISFPKFRELESLEMNSNDPYKQNLKACLEMADVVFKNNGTIEQLEEKVKAYIEKNIPIF
ncbi:AAA family ATPase [bacterium]|nr:AAA family ATPase [bacterium]